ncbi:MAG: hypothetical protein IPK19_41140 [Chloroflexi bacterium]|nr:hypothetical protein [Chloroflexota bacterium]
MSRAESAVMRLYEDSSLRDGLTDEPAARLLRWAEDQLIALDESGVDDAAFEEGVTGILASVKQINHTADRTLSGSAPPDGALAQAADTADVTTIDEMGLVEQLIAQASGQSSAADTTSSAGTTESASTMASSGDALPNAALPNAASMTEDTAATEESSAPAAAFEKSAPPQNFLAGWAQQLLSQASPETDSSTAPPESEEDELT